MVFGYFSLIAVDGAKVCRFGIMDRLSLMPDLFLEKYIACVSSKFIRGAYGIGPKCPQAEETSWLRDRETPPREESQAHIAL